MNPASNPTAAVIETTFLGGKVVRMSLPVVQGPPAAGVPSLKRLLLPQGDLAQFYDSDQGIRYLAAVELRAGCIRGNHYHDSKEEWLYVIEGELALVLEDIESRARATMTLRAGDLAVIRTGVAHAWKTVRAGLAIEFSPARFNAADVHKFAL